MLSLTQLGLSLSIRYPTVAFIISNTMQTPIKTFRAKLSTPSSGLNKQYSPNPKTAENPVKKQLLILPLADKAQFKAFAPQTRGIKSDYTVMYQTKANWQTRCRHT